MMKKIKLYIGVIAIMIFVVLWEIDIQPRYSQFKKLQLTEKITRQTWQEKSKLPSIADSKIHESKWSETDIFKNLVTIIQKNNFSIQAISYQPFEVRAKIKVLPLKLNLSGNFSHLAALLTAISASSFPITVNDFSITLNEQEKITIELHLLVFCFREPSWHFIQQQHDVLDEGSILEMKLAGFIKAENKLVGLLKFPSGETREIKVGEIIGKERARVVAISEEEIIATTLSKKFSIKRDQL